jgi:hypothetical protein
MTTASVVSIREKGPACKQHCQNTPPPLTAGYTYHPSLSCIKPPKHTRTTLLVRAVGLNLARTQLLDFGIIMMDPDPPFTTNLLKVCSASF